MGTGINVTGKLEAGKLQIGDKVVVMPAGEQGLVKSKCLVHMSPLLEAVIRLVTQRLYLSPSLPAVIRSSRNPK